MAPLPLFKPRASSVASMSDVDPNMSSATKQQLQRRNSSKLDSPYMDLPHSASKRSLRVAEERRAGGWSASGGFAKTGGTGNQLRDRHSMKVASAAGTGTNGLLDKYAFQVMGSAGKGRRSNSYSCSMEEGNKNGNGNGMTTAASLPQLTPSKSHSSTTVSSQGSAQQSPNADSHSHAQSQSYPCTSPSALTNGGPPPTIHEQRSIRNLGACLMEEDTSAGAIHSPAQSLRHSTTSLHRRQLSLDDMSRHTSMSTSTSVYFDAAQTESERQASSPAAWVNHFSSTMSLLQVDDGQNNAPKATVSSPNMSTSTISAAPQYLSCQGLVKDATPGMEHVLSGPGLALFAPLDGVPMRPRALVTDTVQPQEASEDCCSRQAVSLASSSVPTVQPQHKRQHSSLKDDQSSTAPSESLPQHIVTPAPSADVTTSNSSSIRHSSSFMEECLFPVDVVPEPQDVMEDCPRLLSEAVMQYLTEHGLPVVIKMRRWVRAYSLARDGDSFEMMMTLVSPHKFTLMVVKTTQGEVFGGFVDSPWDSGKAFGFYGGGQAFLFSLMSHESGDGDDTNTNNSNQKHIKKSPKLSSSSPTSPSHEEQVTLYGWTGSNTYFQVCDESKGSFAMGGGGVDGSFGLCIEDCFWKGSTGPCDTYGNAPLAKQEQFQIVDFEVYGFWF